MVDTHCEGYALADDVLTAAAVSGDMWLADRHDMSASIPPSENQTYCPPDL